MLDLITEQELTPSRILDGQVIRTDNFYIACGGFSEIYRGRWIDSSGIERPVAIKLFRGVHTKEQWLRETKRRLNRETYVWCRLGNDDENLLIFNGVCDDPRIGPSPALISPWCVHGDVMNYLEKFPNANRLQLVKGIANGLRCLHSKDIIHGDLKPQNVLIDGNFTARICDFGRSKIIGHQGHTTSAGGSIRYMAPELFNLVTKPDGRLEPAKLTREADVYSFAMVVLEILTGNYPYYDLKAEMSVIPAVMHEKKINRELYKSPGMSEDIWVLLEKCWSHESQRPDIEEIVRNLAQIS